MEKFQKNLACMLAAVLAITAAVSLFLDCTFNYQTELKAVRHHSVCDRSDQMPEPAEHNTFFSDSLQRSRLNANNSKRRSSSSAANNKSGTSLYQVPLYALNSDNTPAFSADLHLFVFQNYIKYSLPERAGPHIV